MRIICFLFAFFLALHVTPVHAGEPLSGRVPKSTSVPAFVSSPVTEKTDAPILLSVTLLGCIVALATGALLFAKKLTLRALLSLNLLMLLLGVFGIVALLEPGGPVFGALGFFGLLATFRILSAFENIGPKT